MHYYATVLLFMLFSLSLVTTVRCVQCIVGRHVSAGRKGPWTRDPDWSSGQQYCHTSGVCLTEFFTQKYYSYNAQRHKVKTRILSRAVHQLCCDEPDPQRRAYEYDRARTDRYYQQQHNYNKDVSFAPLPYNQRTNTNRREPNATYCMKVNRRSGEGREGRKHGGKLTVHCDAHNHTNQIHKKVKFVCDTEICEVRRKFNGTWFLLWNRLVNGLWSYCGFEDAQMRHKVTKEHQDRMVYNSYYAYDVYGHRAQSKPAPFWLKFRRL